MLSFAAGLGVGALITGFIAHRKPEWFNKAVAAVNRIDDKVNEQIKS